MQIRTEVFAPNEPLEPVAGVAMGPDAKMQDMAARYLGRTLGLLPPEVRSDPALIVALAALTALVSSGVGGPGSTRPLSTRTLPATLWLARSIGLGAAGNPLLAAGGLPRPSAPVGSSASILGRSLSGKGAPAGGLFGHSPCSELAPPQSGAVTLSGPAQQLTGAGQLMAPGSAMAGCDAPGPRTANGSSQALVAGLGLAPASSRPADVVGEVLAAEDPLRGGLAPAPAPAKSQSQSQSQSQGQAPVHGDDRAKGNGLETQLTAQKPVFARVQEAGTDAHVKSHLKFFGAKKSRQSERDRRERDKKRKRHYKLFLAQHGDSDDLESP